MKEKNITGINVVSRESRPTIIVINTLNGNIVKGNMINSNNVNSNIINSNNVNSNVNSKVNEIVGMLPESLVKDMLAAKDKQIEALLNIIKDMKSKARQ